MQPLPRTFKYSEGIEEAADLLTVWTALLCELGNVYSFENIKKQRDTVHYLKYSKQSGSMVVDLVFQCTYTGGDLK